MFATIIPIMDQEMGRDDMTPERRAELRERYGDQWCGGEIAKTNVAELLDALEAAEQTNAELRADKERLDWMIEHSMAVQWARNGKDAPKWYGVWNARGHYRVTPSGQKHSDPREAIDAARKGEGR